MNTAKEMDYKGMKQLHADSLSGMCMMWRLSNPILKVMTIFLAIIVGIAIFTSSAAALGEPYDHSRRELLFDLRTSEYLKIQWVLEKKIIDKTVAEKLVNKPATLNDKHIKLISSV